MVRFDRSLDGWIQIFSGFQIFSVLKATVVAFATILPTSMKKRCIGCLEKYHGTNLSISD